MPLEALSFDPFEDEGGAAAPPDLEPLSFDPFEPADDERAAESIPAGEDRAADIAARDEARRSATQRAMNPLDVGPPAPEPPPAPDQPGAVSRGFVSGLLKQNPEMMAETFEGLSYLSPDQFRDTLGNAAAEFRGLAKLSPEEYAPRAQSIWQARGLDDVMTWAGEAMGQGWASTVPSITTGLAGGAAGSRVGGRVGAVTGAIAGATVPSAALNYGEVYKALKDEKVAPDEAAEWALYATGPITLLDVASIGPIVARLGGADAVKREIVRSVARRVAEEGAKGLGREGITEAAQSAIKEATVSLKTGKPFFTMETAGKIAEEGLAGSLTGGSLGAATGIRPDRPPQAIPPNLTAEDVASPIPNGLISEGKTLVDGLLAGKAVEPTAPPRIEAGAETTRDRTEIASPPAAPTLELLDSDPFADPGLPAGAVPAETLIGREASSSPISEPMNSVSGAVGQPESPTTAAPRMEPPADVDATAQNPAAGEQVAATPGPTTPETETRTTEAPVRPDGDGTRAAPITVTAPEHTEAAAAVVNTAPTDGQKEAGNYAKAHVKLQGLDISIENPRGSTRTGTGPDGSTWSVEMPAAYGYLKRTEGADGDQVDAYIGESPASPFVFLIDQVDADSRAFDEHKALMAFRSRSEALAAYDAAFSDGRGPERRGAVTQMSVARFKEWLASGDTTKPMAYREPAAPVRARDAQTQPVRKSAPEPTAAAVSPASPRSEEITAPRPAARATDPAPAATPARSTITAREVARDTAVTAAGREVPVRYAVVEAADLVPSQTDAGTANPAYPAELQPRDRERAVSQQQVSAIAQNLNPRLLDRSPKASDGAPIVAADGVVESGNGRVLAIRRAYAQGGAQAYSDYLAAQGYPVDGMREPVLVRIRDGEMAPEERQAFTREANERDTLGMSATERAMADAAAMPDAVLELYRGGDVDAAANRQFVRAFMREVVAENDQAGMIGADGALSQEAIRRVQAALLARAYQDADLVSSLVESTDSNIRAIGGALMDVAGGWAQMRAEAGAGRIDPSMDQTEALLEAVRVVQRARRDGRSVAEFVGQGDLLTGQAGLPPTVRAFLDLFFRDAVRWTSPAGRDRMADALRFYVTEAGKTTAGVDLLGESAPAPERIVAAAREKTLGRREQDQQADLLAQPTRGAGDRERSAGRERTERAEPDPAEARGGEVAGRGGEGAAAGVGSLDELRAAWTARGVENWAAERNGIITLSSVIVPEGRRSRGLGTAFMQDLIEYADATGQTIALTPSKDFGASSVERLRRFYGRFGFVQNKGPDKDFRTQEAMVRQPEGEVPTGRERRAPRTDDVAAEERALEDELRRLGLGDQVAVRLVEVIRDLRGRPVPEARGHYAYRLIDIAIAARGKLKTLHHEVIHALRDLNVIRPAEWRAVQRRVEGDADLMAWAEREYPELDREGQIEEAAAELFSEWMADRATQPPRGFVRTAFERIKALLDAIGRWATGRGFTDADMVFGRIDRGTVGRRAQDDVGTAAGDDRFATAWHGGPHDFDAFDTGKIGTGEGAQAYGWGLYFANRKGIAEYYRDKEVRKRFGEFPAYKRKTVGRMKRGGTEPVQINDDWHDALGAVLERAVDSDTTLSEAFRAMRQERQAKSVFTRWLYQDLTKLEQVLRGAEIVDAPGRLYQVDLAPAETDYLLWDKPLAEQSDTVKAALANVRADLETAQALDDYLDRMNATWDDLTGKELYTLLKRASQDDAIQTNGPGVEQAQADGRDDKAVSLYLRNENIRGIKYLDGGSRAQGDGSFNYVIFDAADVTIEGKFARAPRTLDLTAVADNEVFAVPTATARWMGFDGLNLRANFTDLQRRHPEELHGYQDIEELKSDVAFVLNGPENWGIHQGGRVVIWRSGGGLIPTVRIDLEKEARSGAYQIASVYRVRQRSVTGMIRERDEVLRQMGLAAAPGPDGPQPGNSRLSDYLRELSSSPLTVPRDTAPGRRSEDVDPDEPQGKTARGERRPTDSLRDAEDGTVEQRQQAMQGMIARGQPLDRALRLPFDILGGVDADGRWNPGRRLFDGASRIITEAKIDPAGRFGWMAPMVEKARAGLIDRYGLPEAYVERDRRRARDERAIAAQGLEFLNQLRTNDFGTEESRVLQAVLTGEDVADADMARVALPIRQAIDELGQEAVHLGLLSPESYERNRGAYLHRVYMKHEAEQNGLSRWIGQAMGRSRQKIIGDQFKGRGMFLDIDRARLMRDVPGFAEGTTGAAQPGDRFIVLDRIPEQEALEGVDRGPPAVIDRVYWPADQAIPDRFADYTDRGTWEARGTRLGKVTLWRDFTKAEREQMGEILDARYTIGRTFMMMAHDLATGRFYKDIAENEEWTSTSEPAGKWLDGADANRTFGLTDPDVMWVKVPESEVAGTGGKLRWGALAGKWVRAEIWRDINEIDRMSRPGPWRKALTQWKLNKTARSPVVHLNNIMSNIVLMDMVDVRAQDLTRGVREYMNAGPEYRAALEHGAFGVDLVSQEIRKEVLEPVLRELQNEVTGSTASPMLARFGAAGVLADKLWRGVRGADRWMIERYRMEDDVFRMATYLRRRQIGDSPQQAAAVAREQFIDYDIRAPWVNAARNSVLPFISYTYRAAPLIAKAVATRPWKVAKYALLGYVASTLAYMATGDDDDEADRERRSMREQERGYTWFGSPRMLRMPWRDERGMPVFLDIRRWVPGGDIFDTGQGSSALPIPAPLQFGGPLQLAFELALNKQGFTGREITNSKTDTWWDKAGKTGDYLWKAWMPSAAWVPGSWYWSKIEDAAYGVREKGTDRPLSLPQAALSSVGVKLGSQDIERNFSWRAYEFDKVEQDLKKQARDLAKDRERGALSEKAYVREMQRNMEKMQRLNERRAETFTPRSERRAREETTAP